MTGRLTILLKGKCAACGLVVHVRATPGRLPLDGYLAVTCLGSHGGDPDNYWIELQPDPGEAA